jgi:hypothetical protein
LEASLFLVTALGYPQISPGSISPFHQSLEGATKCVTCHNFGLANRSLKCLDCHVEIGPRMEERSGYHARVYNRSPTQTDCAYCHMEHNGRQFPFTKLDRKKFDHRGSTGFVLEGKHAQSTCEQRHNVSHIPAAACGRDQNQSLNKTYLA